MSLPRQTAATRPPDSVDADDHAPAGDTAKWATESPQAQAAAARPTHPRSLSTLLAWAWGGLVVLMGMAGVAAGSGLGWVTSAAGALCLPPVMRLAQPRIGLPRWTIYFLSIVLLIAIAPTMPGYSSSQHASSETTETATPSVTPTGAGEQERPQTRGTAKKEELPTAAAAPTASKTMYVLERVEERLGPSWDEKVTNTLYRQTKVDVYETNAGWARVSRFYDGAVEDHVGTVARWVPLAGLSPDRPADLPQPKVAHDPRVDGLPKVGENGLTKRDVLILQAAARYYLETGQAQRIEHGDKSISRPGVYYLNFGGPSNHFFSPADIPDLEERIAKLGK